MDHERYAKTAAGMQEVEHRKHKLEYRQRMLLVLMNDMRSVDAAIDMLRPIGADEDDVRLLIDRGLIEPVSPLVPRPEDVALDETEPYMVVWAG